MNEVILYLKSAFAITCWQLLIFFVPTLVLTICVHLTSAFIEREGIRVFGKYIYLYVFGWLGTICHELGHAIFCVIFRHKINEIKLFSPNPSTGSLGYVNHSYEPTNLYQSLGNFFIGVGPVLLGTLVIYVSAVLLLDLSSFPSEELVISIQNYFTDSFSDDTFEKVKVAGEHLVKSFQFIVEHRSWHLYLFVYIAFSIGSSITLSGSDIKGAWSGLVVLLLSIYVVNLSTFWFTTPTEERYQFVAQTLTIFYAVLLFSVILNLIASVVLLSLSTVKGFLFSD